MSLQREGEEEKGAAEGAAEEEGVGSGLRAVHGPAAHVIRRSSMATLEVEVIRAQGLVASDLNGALSGEGGAWGLKQRPQGRAIRM